MSLEPKKIAIVGIFHAEAFASHISHALKTMGHEVVPVKIGPEVSVPNSKMDYKVRRLKLLVNDIAGSISFVAENRNRKLVERIEDAGSLDLVIVCHDFLFPETIKEIKEKSRAPVVIWFPDSLSVWGSHKFLNAAFDFIFLKDPYVVQVLNSMISKKVYYLPECFNPDSLGDPVFDPKFVCDVATAGNLYAYRVAFFEELMPLGLNVRIWGNPAPDWMDTARIRHCVTNRFVSDSEKASLFRSAAIIVNNLHPAEIYGVNARTFEIAGAGGFQMIDWRPGLDRLFREGSEVVSFRSMEQLKELIGTYLSSESLRLEIAANARTRALAEHTYERRLNLMLDTVFAGASGFDYKSVDGQ